MLYHFVYKTVHPNGRYYIGRHTTSNVDDGYFGSGVWVSGIKNKSVLQREILMYADSSEHLKILEENAIMQYWDDPLCMNRGKGSRGWTSEESTQSNVKRVLDGTHNFLNGEIPKRTQLKRVAEGTHQWIGDKNPTHQRLKDRTHLWLGDEHKQLTSQRNKQRFENNTHHFLQHIQCSDCGKTGQMTAMKRWHFENCKHHG